MRVIKADPKDVILPDYPYILPSKMLFMAFYDYYFIIYFGTFKHMLFNYSLFGSLNNF